MKFIPLLVSIILISCNSGFKTPNLKNVKPGKLAFFETYSFSEIAPSWQAACDWVNSQDSLVLQGKVNLMELDKRGLAALVRPNGEFMVGYVKDTDMQWVNETLSLPEVKKHFFKDLRFLWSYSAEEEENGHRLYALYAVKIPVGNKAKVDGRQVISAEYGISEYNQSNIITISMNNQGSHDWELMTRKNIGRAIAIVFDDYVLSAPVVNDAIAGGKTEISGNFTEAEAEELAARIYAGRKQ